MADKQNIVLIMTDTQGTNAVGAYCGRDVKTPCLDRMCEEGIRFDNAYTCQPVCGPARAAIFTGVYPHTNGVLANNIPLGANIKTVGQRMEDSGYHTAYMGKWHCDGTDYFGNGICPPGWDPEYWYDMRMYLEELPEEQRPEYRQKYCTVEAMHENDITEEFCYAHRCSDRALNFLENHACDDAPYFMVVSYDEPHGPFTCPPPFCDMHTEFKYQLGPNGKDPMTDKPEHQREWMVPGYPDTGGISEVSNPMYFGCNSYVDYEIGRVLDAVEKHDPDALVIYTSDHGTPLGTHGLWSKGPAMYEETCNIPFIVKWGDRSPASRITDVPVSHIDLVPTILDAAGLEVPPFLEGKSILKSFEDPSVKINDEIFIEFNRYEVNHDGWGGFQPIRCAFDGRYKLVVNLHYTDELYDLKEDPYEMVNLIESDKLAGIRDDLHDRILSWMDRTRDPLRGPIWERREWRKERRQTWNGSGMTRPRRDDGYEPRMLLYETGLPVDKWEYKK